MRRRAIIFLILITQVLFLNVIIPGHIRGNITMDGKRDCCEPAGKTCCDKPAKDANSSHSAPTQKDKAKCFICYLAHGYTPMIWVTIDLAPLGRVRVQPIVRLHAVHVPSLPLTRFPCGPPTV